MIRRLVSLSILGSLGACAARSAAPAPLDALYQFKVGEVLTYQVESRLSVSMDGTHPALLTKGNVSPLTWKVAGVFENAVKEFNEERGLAVLERRVRRIKSTGDVYGEGFGFEWDRGKHKAPHDMEKRSSMDRFVASMVSSPQTYGVDAEGRTSVPNVEHNRLVVRLGMMSWPIRRQVLSWTSSEVIAVPILHDKVGLLFKNSIAGSSSSTARISAPVALKEVPAAGGIPEGKANYTVSGHANAEFDTVAGRLHKLEIDLTITFSGKGGVPGGGEGDIKGVVSYRETQRLVQ